MSKKRKRKERANQEKPRYFNRSMLSDGVIFFTFSLILLGVEERTITLFSHEIVTFPDWVYTWLGVITLAISVIFLLAAYSEKTAEIIYNLIQSSASFLYWLVFGIVYLLTFVKGLAAIQQNVPISFFLLIGCVYFLIITIIFVNSLIKSIRKYWLPTGKNKK